MTLPIFDLKVCQLQMLGVLGEFPEKAIMTNYGGMALSSVCCALYQARPA